MVNFQTPSDCCDQQQLIVVQQSLQTLPCFGKALIHMQYLVLRIKKPFVISLIFTLNTGLKGLMLHSRELLFPIRSNFNKFKSSLNGQLKTTFQLSNYPQQLYKVQNLSVAITHLNTVCQCCISHITLTNWPQGLTK